MAARARGIACHRSITELPEAPDSIIMAIPASAVIDTVREAAAKGTRNGVAYAGGMAEAGGEGVELERRLAALCRENRLRAVRPELRGHPQCSHACHLHLRDPCCMN